MSASVVAGAPEAAIAPQATPGDGRATVRWNAAPNNGAPITEYVITPYLGRVAQRGGGQNRSRQLLELIAGRGVEAVPAHGPGDIPDSLGGGKDIRRRRRRLAVGSGRLRTQA